jgi:Ohr subfamily peroxiredoxin
MTPLYTAHSTATAGRNGHGESSDGILKFDLSIPKEMGGPGKAGATNPEQLFSLGYAACFGGAMELVARNQGKKLSGPANVRANVSIGKDDTSFALAVTLEAWIDGLSAAETQSIMEAAHQVCPYSKATRGNVEVTLKALAEAAAA